MQDPQKMLGPSAHRLHTEAEEGESEETARNTLAQVQAYRSQGQSYWNALYSVTAPPLSN